MAGDDEPPGQSERRPDGGDGRLRAILPDDRYLDDPAVDGVGDGQQFDVPREAGFVEVRPDPRPGLPGQRLRATLVVVEVDVEEPAGQPREAVAEVPAGDRLVGLDGRVGVPARPGGEVGLARRDRPDHVGDGRRGRAAVGVGEGQHVRRERLEPGGDRRTLAPTGGRLADGNREGVDPVQHAGVGGVEFDADRLGGDRLSEGVDVAFETVDVRVVGGDHHPDGSGHGEAFHDGRKKANDFDFRPTPQTVYRRWLDSG